MDWFVTDVASKVTKNVRNHAYLMAAIERGSRKVKWLQSSDREYQGSDVFLADLSRNTLENEIQLSELITRYDGSQEQQKLLQNYTSRYLGHWSTRISKYLLSKLALWIYAVRKCHNDWVRILTYDFLIRRAPNTCVDERDLLGGVEGTWNALWQILIELARSLDTFDSQAARSLTTVISTNYEVWRILRNGKMRLRLFYFTLCCLTDEVEFEDEEDPVSFNLFTS